MGHFEQAQLEMEALLLLVAKFAVRAEHDLQVTGEIFFTKPIGNPGDPFALLAGNLQQGGIFAGDFRDGSVAQETHHLAGEVRGAVAFTDQMIDVAEDFFRSALADRLHHQLENVGGRSADQHDDYQPWIDNDRRLRELLTRLEALGAAALDADPRWKR